MDKKLKAWIQDNRYIIDAVIQNQNPHQVEIDDQEREIWIKKHESLYTAAVNAQVMD